MVLNEHATETLLLDDDIENYEYLNKSRREVDGIDDREEWNLLQVRTSTELPWHISSDAVFRRML